MTNLEPELDLLKENIEDMMALVIGQLVKCKEATINSDDDLAKQIVANDKRVNAMELKIDKDCENILALYTPVATDLRFLLASLKINNDLERIGDNIEGIAGLMTKVMEKAEDGFFEEFKLIEMFDNAISMLQDIQEALINDDSKLARKIFKKDEFLSQNNINAVNVTITLFKQYPEKAKTILRLFTVIRKLERIGYLTKNLGEEIIFHLDAEVMKDRKSRIKFKKTKRK